MRIRDFLALHGGEMLELTLEHLFLVLVSTGVAILIGVPLGILLTRRPALTKPVLGFANVMQTVPSLALFDKFGAGLPIVSVSARQIRRAEGDANALLIDRADSVLVPVVRGRTTIDSFLVLRDGNRGWVPGGYANTEAAAQLVTERRRQPAGDYYLVSVPSMNGSPPVFRLGRTASSFGIPLTPRTRSVTPTRKAPLRPRRRPFSPWASRKPTPVGGALKDGGDLLLGQSLRAEGGWDYRRGGGRAAGGGPASAER